MFLRSVFLLTAGHCINVRGVTRVAWRLDPGNSVIITPVCPAVAQCDNVVSSPGLMYGDKPQVRTLQARRGAKILSFDARPGFN